MLQIPDPEEDGNASKSFEHRRVCGRGDFWFLLRRSDFVDDETYALEAAAPDSIDRQKGVVKRAKPICYHDGYRQAEIGCEIGQ